MASTYSNLKIQLMTTGENATTWGSITNTNLGTAIEEAIAGSADVSFSSGDVTLTLANTNATQPARNMRLNLTGTSGGARNLTVPAIEKVYIINNGLADTVTVKNATGTTVSIPSGKSMIVFSTGTGIVDVTNYLSSLSLGSALPVASGGTGLTAPGTASNVLTSTGTAWTSTALPPSFVAGMILMWSGSIGTIPSGWQICDGTNGTPDLRDRFVVGAGSTYSVATTGGSANAIVVDHTHTASSTQVAHNHTVSSATNNTGYSVGAYGTPANLPIFGAYTATTSSATPAITTTVNSTGSSGTNANLPPYYALAYIMKL